MNPNIINAKSIFHIINIPVPINVDITLNVLSEILFTEYIDGNILLFVKLLKYFLAKICDAEFIAAKTIKHPMIKIIFTFSSIFKNAIIPTNIKPTANIDNIFSYFNNNTDTNNLSVNNNLKVANNINLFKDNLINGLGTNTSEVNKAN